MASKPAMRSMPHPPPKAKQTMEDKASIESMLLDYTQRLARHPAGRRAVIIHLSRLRPDNRRSYYIRIAANTFEGLVKHLSGQIFLLQNADIVFICKDASIAAIDAAVMRLRYLFGDDPLAADFADDAPDRFVTWYDLERDYPAFLALAEELHEQRTRRRKRLAAIPGGAQEERPPMDPEALGELMDALQRTDLSKIMRRQAICILLGDGAPRALFREIYISIPDLSDAVLPRHDIASERWLFQYLTQRLDKRVLALLREQDDPATAHSYSLNLNISTLLSREFLQFDQALKPDARGTIIIELQKVDIFADPGAYLFARDFLRERGYRLCLDGVSAVTLPFIDREGLGLDFVKMFWTPDMADPLHTERTDAFRDALERCGRSRIILARCESEEAIRFGQSVGIRLFQGRHIDRLLSIAPGATAARTAG